MARTIRLFDVQGEAYLSDKQFIIVVCGSQSGKTFLGATWARTQMQENGKKNGLISAPTYKVLNQSTLDKLFSMYPELRPYYKEQKQEICLPEGGKVFVRSADQPLGIEGMTIDWGWLDEYGQASRLAWTVCKTRVSTTGGRLMVTTTPYALNWLYEDCYKPWLEKTDPRIDLFTWNSITNPHFKPEHYKAEKAVLSPEEFGRRYEGKFTRMAGMVYPDFSDSMIEKPSDIKPIETFAGVDFGFTNPACVLVIQRNKDNHFWVVDEWYEAGRDQPEINDICNLFKRKHNFNLFYPDIAEPDRILSMKRAGLVPRDANKDVEFGIDRVRQLIRQDRLRIFDNCQNLIDELHTYHYPEDIEKGIKETPVKEKDHACDALRYAIASHPMDFLKGKGMNPKGKQLTPPRESAFQVDFKSIIEENQSEQSNDWKYV